MPSPFIDLAQAVKDALLEAPAIADGLVFRSRTRALKKGHPHGIVVRLVKTGAALAGVGLQSPKDWSTVIGLDILKRADADTDAPEDDLDPLLTAVYARLAGRALPGLGVIDVFSEPTVEWDSDDAEEQISRATVLFQVIHRTQPEALVAWA